LLLSVLLVIFAFSRSLIISETFLGIILSSSQDNSLALRTPSEVLQRNGPGEKGVT
jgi:hypothetical protein